MHASTQEHRSTAAALPARERKLKACEEHAALAMLNVGTRFFVIAIKPHCLGFWPCWRCSNTTSFKGNEQKRGKITILTAVSGSHPTNIKTVTQAWRCDCLQEH